MTFDRKKFDAIKAAFTIDDDALRKIADDFRADMCAGLAGEKDATLRMLRREKEIENLKNTLSPYEFESTQLNAINKYFNFEEYIYSEDYVKVTKTFKDYYGFTHFVGEKWYFSCAYFLPYEDGYTLYISKNKIDINEIGRAHV